MSLTSGVPDQHVPVLREPDGKAVVVQARKRVAGDPTLCGLALLNGLIGAVVVGGIGTWALWAGALEDETYPSTPENLAAVVALLASGLCTAAVVAAASAQSDGREIRGRQAWALLRGRWLAVLAWVALSVAVNLGSDAVFGLVGLEGLLSFAFFLTWLLVSVYALPVAVLTGALPHRALARSVAMVRDTFQYTLANNLRALFPWMIWAVGALLLSGIGALTHYEYAGENESWAAAGLILAALGLAGTYVAVAMQCAVSAVINAMVLRHRLGLPTPGLSPTDFPARPEA